MRPRLMFPPRLLRRWPLLKLPTSKEPASNYYSGVLFLPILLSPPPTNGGLATLTAIISFRTFHDSDSVRQYRGSATGAFRAHEAGGDAYAREPCRAHRGGCLWKRDRPQYPRRSRSDADRRRPWHRDHAGGPGQAPRQGRPETDQGCPGAEAAAERGIAGNSERGKYSASSKSRRHAGGDSRSGRERHWQDHDHRQVVAGIPVEGQERIAVCGGYLPRGSDRSAGNLGRTHRYGSDQDQARRRSRSSVVRRIAGGNGAEDRLCDRGHRRPAAHQGQPHVGTGEDAAHGPAHYSWSTARNVAGDGCHDRAEWFAAGAPVYGVGGRYRHRAYQA